MPAKMYIPVSITLTEHEYVIINNLMQELDMDDNQFSEAMRKIIREWHSWKCQELEDGITPRERKAPLRRGLT
jgi:hypothetical protein